MVQKGIRGKMWYKLPYEDISDKTPLFDNADENKRKMNANGRWYKELDVFIEKDESGVVSRIDRAESAAVSPIERAEITVVSPIERDADESEDNTYDGDHEVEESEDEYQASDKSDNEEDIDQNFEEDLEMFRDENYEDEILDEDEVYPDTELSSDEEEAQAEKMAKRGELDGVFSLRQTFYSGEEFKKQVIKYILKERRNVVFDRWEKTKIGAKCSGKGCVWRIYYSIEKPIKQWMVKVYVNTHTCYPTGKCKLIKSPAIAEVMLEKIRKDLEMSAPKIKEEFRDKFNIIISSEQAKIARRIVLDKLQAECNEHFARLRDYEMELLRSNPNSKIEINTTTKPNGAKALHSMYICFDKKRVAWKEYCRPVIGLDGTFLKHSSLQGMILTAIGRDPNNQIYPVAWAVVDGESNDNWEWFIHRLKIDLGLGSMDDRVTIISDQHKGLIHGVAVVLPRAEHRACAWYIYSNLKKNHKSDTLKPLFWRVASSYNEAD